MDNKETSYSIKIKMSGFLRYINESDENFEQRVKKEGKKRMQYYLSGYLFDPENENIFEEINFEKLNNK